MIYSISLSKELDQKLKGIIEYHSRGAPIRVNASYAMRVALDAYFEKIKTEAQLERESGTYGQEVKTDA